MKEKIIEIAKKLNIDLIGFTNSEKFMNREEFLKKRQELGDFCEFEEYDIDSKIDPKKSFHKCKSIIVVGLSYNNESGSIELPSNYGLLSKSAWGTDYHIVLKEMIEKLIAEISQLVNFDYKYFVDTGALMERELAYRAGIGYFGKNCNIISEKYGSFIFLGHILTDLDIEPNIPIESKCGDCRRCLEACPTGALYDSYKVNPRKCISYITQSKKEMEFDLLSKIGCQIFGCDKCQNVCPKNKNVEKSRHSEFIPEYIAMDIDLLKKISNKEFKNIYGRSSAQWRGKKILIRNAEIIEKNRNL